MKLYFAKVTARPKFRLPGGVKKWRSFPQTTYAEARAVLTGYLDGHLESVATVKIEEEG